jgi:hypothetical protein
MTKHGFVHADLEELSFDAWIDPLIFKGIQMGSDAPIQPSGNTLREKVKVFGLSSYKGHCLTARIFVEKYGAIWDYIPFHLLFKAQTTESYTNLFSLKQLCYHNCPDENVAINYSSFFQQNIVPSTNAMAMMVQKNSQQQKVLFGAHIVEYLASVDWHKNNKSGHVVWLYNGQLAMVPNHKLIIKTTNNTSPIPLDWHAIKDEWIIS